MNNIEYLKQKIAWYGEAESIETAAKLYLLGSGFDEKRRKELAKNDLLTRDDMLRF